MKVTPAAILLLTIAAACSNQKSSEKAGSSLTISNPSSTPRQEIISLPNDGFPKGATGIGQIGNVPVEILGDKVIAQVSIGPEKTIEITPKSWKAAPDYPKKTQAEISVKTGGAWQGREYIDGFFENVDFLRVPAEHTDHSWYIRYEGPGLENELIGYRTYLDWRNATDIFGKKVDTLVLQQVGLDGFDSYHEEADWGMDILKAGKSLGIGSIGRLSENQVVEHFEKTDSVTCRITNGHLSSAITINYFGWETSRGKVDLKSKQTINSGDRAVTHNVSFNMQVDHFCTGIVKHPEGSFMEKRVGDWAYIATYGKQTLFDDNLGMAIIYNINEVDRIKKDDPFSHLVMFKPSANLSYQLLGAWQGEPNGVESLEDFTTYLDKKLLIANNPLIIE